MVLFSVTESYNNPTNREVFISNKKKYYLTLEVFTVAASNLVNKKGAQEFNLKVQIESLKN